MMYRLNRDAAVDWCRVLSHVGRKVALYIDARCESAAGRVHCLVSDDTEIVNPNKRKPRKVKIETLMA